MRIAHKEVPETPFLPILRQAARREDAREQNGHACTCLSVSICSSCLRLGQLRLAVRKLLWNRISPSWKRLSHSFEAKAQMESKPPRGALFLCARLQQDKRVAEPNAAHVNVETSSKTLSPSVTIRTPMVRPRRDNQLFSVPP